MPIDNPINAFELACPIVQCIHVAGFALSAGTVAIVDFRLLGLILPQRTPAQLLRETALWTLSGVILMIVTGLLLFSSDPDMYLLNFSFDLKMILLALAIAFNYTIHRRAVQSSPSPVTGKFVACASLALWISVLFGGIFIGFSPQVLGFKA